LLQPGVSSTQSGADNHTKKEVTITTAFQDDLLAVAADQSQIEQVLLNLFVNAWQAMENGGQLHLETVNLTLNAEQVTPYGLAPGPFVRIAVKDTGKGMDEQTRSRIFDPFFTTKEKARGTGLGLASQAIDLVILDMVMPVMGGGETFDRLKALDPRVKVLLSSGYSIDEQAQAIIDRGCCGFIQKPYHLDSLAAKVHEALAASADA